RELALSRGRPSRRDRTVGDLEALAVAPNGHGARVVGPEQGDPLSLQERECFRVGVAIIIALPAARHSEFRPNEIQPRGVGAVPAAVVRELQDRAVAGQVRAMAGPPLALELLAVAGQEDRLRPMPQSESD